MPFSLKTWGLAFVIGILLDMAWLGFIAKSFYIRELGSIGRIEDGSFKPVIWAAAAVYIAIGFGLAYFVLPRAESLAGAAITGALMGLTLYATYDFTNYSTLKDFTVALTFVDMAWGTFLGGATSSITYWIAQKFL